MVKRLEEWYSVKETIGISCTADSGNMLFHLCRIKRQRDSIDIIEQQSFDDSTVLLDYLAKEKPAPISLHIQGKGVLIKQMEVVEALTPDQVQAVFPNYSEDTYVYSYFRGEETAWLSLMKTELLERILHMFEETGLGVVRVFIGPSVADNVLDQLNGYSGDYLFNGHRIRRNSDTKQWQSYQYDREVRAAYRIKLQGTDIPEQSIMAYSAAFSLLMHGFVQEVYVPFLEVDSRFEDLLQKRRFQVNGMVVLMAFFVLLLINTVVYMHYQDRYEVLRYQSKENFSNANELDKLSTAVAANDSLLRQLGWNGGLQKSWIINQLAKSLEGRTGIDWQQVEINPYAVRRLSGAVSEVDNRYKVSIAGVCLTLRELERWVRTLGQRPWMEQVEISRFVDQNKPNAVGKDFVITIQYRYDF